MTDVEFDIQLKIAQLRFILNAIKMDKPVKPVRRRVSKKYKKIQEHYIEVIEDFNQQREALKGSLQCVIELIELILADQLKELKTEALEEQVQAQRELNIKLYKSFGELKSIMRIAIEL